MPERAGTQERDETRRDPFLDNARSALIFLVVVGHAISAGPLDRGPMRALYLWIFAFHMPMFILISGFLSKRLAVTWRARASLAIRILGPFFIFQLIWRALGYPSFSLGWRTLYISYWIMWFLLALFIWRLTLPLYARFRWALPLAVAGSVVIGSTDFIGREFSAMRVITFLPFFIAGYRIDGSVFERLKTRNIGVASASVLVVLLAAMLAAGDHVDLSWTYMNRSYASMGLGTWLGPLVRLGYLAIAFVAGFAFLSLLPARATWFTRLGTRTLTVYLLHGFIIRGVAASALYRTADPWVRDVFVFPFAVAVTLALSWGPLHRLVTTVTQPMWILRPKKSAAEA